MRANDSSQVAKATQLEPCLHYLCFHQALVDISRDDRRVAS
jgi:hypothetical protein